MKKTLEILKESVSSYRKKQALNIKATDVRDASSPNNSIKESIHAYITMKLNEENAEQESGGTSEQDNKKVAVKKERKKASPIVINPEIQTFN